MKRGETIIITRPRQAIARIIPEARLQRQEVDQAIEDLKELGKETGTIIVEEILARRDAGRNY